jgi:hypothetical protein
MARGVTLSMAVLLLAACGEGRPNAAAPAVTPPPVPALDAVGEAAASYRLAATIQPAELARGGSGTLAVTIEMLRPDVHVQQEFPLKVTLSPTAGLGLAASALGHAQARDPEAKGRDWKVAVRPLAAGPQQVGVELRFAVCKESEPAWCVVRNEKLSATVAVR